MSIKITGLTAENTSAIESTYPDRVDLTVTTAKFWGHREHVLAQLEVAKATAAERNGTKQHPYASLHAVVRKVTKAVEK